MQLFVEVEESGSITRTATCNAVETEKVKEVVERVATELAIDTAEILESIGVGDVRFDVHATVADCVKHGHQWRHRRECIDLHFESESARHHFPAKAHWARVHQWGCKHFKVAHDACANLELRDGAPDGPALNERKEIGEHHGCETVWLVKPGPEPNGYSTGEINS